MFIAHLPSGYILGHYALRSKTGGIITAALLGSIFPDFDLLYFYLIDNRQHNHHSYWSHYPIVWATFLVVTGAWLLCSKKSRTALLLSVFALGGCLHLFLDAFVGEIMLFAPFSQSSWNIFPVNIKPVLDPWWLNFIFHWSFLLEIGITLFAAVLFVRDIKKNRASLRKTL